MTATPTPETVERLWRAASAARAYSNAECSCLGTNETHDDDCTIVTTEAALREALASLDATYPGTLDVTRQAAYLYLCTLPKIRAALAVLDATYAETVTATR